MIRLFLRSLGLLALAAGFAQAVVDGARSIAGGALAATPLATVVETLAPGRLALLGPRVGDALHPWLWDPLTTTLLAAPAFLTLTLAGAALLLAGRKRADASPGFDPR